MNWVTKIFWGTNILRMSRYWFPVAFLVNRKLFLYNNVNMTLVYEILYINQFYLNNDSSFLECDWGPDISEGTNILRSCRDTLVLCWVLWNIKDHLINVKIPLVYGILNVSQLNIYNPSIFQKSLQELQGYKIIS